jgi:hypothetical protein
MTAAYEYKIGTTYGGLTNLEDMATPIPAPKHSLIEYSKPTILGDTTVRGLGWRRTTWHWDFLTQAQYTALRVLCAALSSFVYINTRKNDGSYQVYTATMIWPANEPEFVNNKLLDIDVEFRALLEYTP